MSSGASVRYEVRWMYPIGEAFNEAVFYYDKFDEAKSCAVMAAEDGHTATIIRVNRKVIETIKPKGT